MIHVEWKSELQKWSARQYLQICLWTEIIIWCLTGGIALWWFLKELSVFTQYLLNYNTNVDGMKVWTTKMMSKTRSRNKSIGLELSVEFILANFFYTAKNITRWAMQARRWASSFISYWLSKVYIYVSDWGS